MFVMSGMVADLKKSYVDVFNPGGKSSGPASLPAPDAFATMAAGNAQMNFFVPQPVANQNAPTDFLTPAQRAEETAQVIWEFSPVTF